MQPKVSSTDIAEQLRFANPNVVVHPQNILNHKANVRKTAFEGRTATQQFIHELREDPEAVVFIRHEGNAVDGRIDAVFWTYSWCINQLRRNPEVLSIHNTYKTTGSICPSCNSMG
jgi:hypothetical protein